MGIPEIREQGPERTGNSQWNPNPRSVCWAFESRRKVNIELLASQTHELSAAETRPGYVLSELYPPLPPCVENLQVSMRETHRRGRRSNITPPCGRGEDTGGCWDYIDWRSVTLAPSYYSL